MLVPGWELNPGLQDHLVNGLLTVLMRTWDETDAKGKYRTERVIAS